MKKWFLLLFIIGTLIPLDSICQNNMESFLSTLPTEDRQCVEVFLSHLSKEQRESIESTLLRGQKKSKERMLKTIISQVRKYPQIFSDKERVNGYGLDDESKATTQNTPTDPLEAILSGFSKEDRALAESYFAHSPAARDNFVNGQMQYLSASGRVEYIRKLIEKERKDKATSEEDKIFTRNNHTYYCVPFCSISVDKSRNRRTASLYNNITAKQIADSLKMSVDSLYYYCNYWVMDMNRYNGEDGIAAQNFYKKIYKIFFTAPYPTVGELKEIYLPSKQGKRGCVSAKNIGDNFSLYIPKEKREPLPQSAYIIENENDVVEKMTFVDNLKTYSGPYTLHGFSGIWRGEDSSEGIATYQYYDAPDGSRIYEGKFSFKEEPGGPYGHTCIAEGYFKDNHQVGDWYWWNFPQSSDGNKIECSVRFNEDGILDGKFCTRIGEGRAGQPGRSYYTGEFKNGKLVSLDYRDGGVWCNGKYNAEGKPIGTWTVGESGKHSIEIFYDDFGNAIKGGYRDERTGDWIKGYSSYPVKLYNETITAVGHAFLRSTASLYDYYIPKSY